MKLTTKSRYGTRLVLDIAVYGKGKPIPLGDIAKRQKISLKYLEQLVGRLKKAGIINSLRGASGGHMLARSAEKITVGDIVRTLEEPAVFVDCALEEDQVCGICNRAGECMSRWVWVEAGRALFDRLDQISIADILAVDAKQIKNMK